MDGMVVVPFAHLQKIGGVLAEYVNDLDRRRRDAQEALQSIQQAAADAVQQPAATEGPHPVE